MKIFSSLDLSVKFKVWRGVHRIKCVILEFCVITRAFILYTESNPWTQRAHAHSTRLLFRGDPPAALDDVCFLGAVGELVLQRSVFLVFIVTFQVISERNEMDIVALKSLQTATLTVWRGLFWLYNTLITPLCYLWRLFPCTHLQNCLSDGFFFHFFFFFICGNFTQQQQSSYWFIELCLIQITIQSDCNCSLLCDANEGVREYAFPSGDFYLNHSRWNS